MPVVKETLERKSAFAPPRSAMPVPGEAMSFAAFLALLRGPGCFLLFFTGIGVALFLFGLAGTFGPYRDSLRENGDPRFFLAAMGMGTIFALVALRMLQVFATGSRHETRREKTRVDPGQPWASDYPWKPQGMLQDGSTGIGGMVLGRVAFLALIGFFNLALASGSWIFIIIIVVLDLFGLLILYDSLQKLWQGLRFGRPRITWTTFPAFTGSRLEAVLSPSRQLSATGPVRATLRRLKDEWTERPADRSGNVRRALEPFIHYEQEVEIPVSQGPLQEVRIEIEVPGDQPGTDLLKEEAVYWQLLVQVPVVGPDFESVFLAPVYRPVHGGRKK
jgi:hypothetical protein